MVAPWPSRRSTSAAVKGARRTRRRRMRRGGSPGYRPASSTTSRSRGGASVSRGAKGHDLSLGVDRAGRQVGQVRGPTANSPSSVRGLVAYLHQLQVGDGGNSSARQVLPNSSSPSPGSSAIRSSRWAPTAQRVRYTSASSRRTREAPAPRHAAPRRRPAAGQRAAPRRSRRYGAPSLNRPSRGALERQQQIAQPPQLQRPHQLAGLRQQRGLVRPQAGQPALGQLQQEPVDGLQSRGPLLRQRRAWRGRCRRRGAGRSRLGGASGGRVADDERSGLLQQARAHRHDVLAVAVAPVGRAGAGDLRLRGEGDAHAVVGRAAHRRVGRRGGHGALLHQSLAQVFVPGAVGGVAR